MASLSEERRDLQSGVSIFGDKSNPWRYLMVSDKTLKKLRPRIPDDRGPCRTNATTRIRLMLS